MRKQLKLILISVGIVVLGLAVAGISAYFMSLDKTTNQFLAGNNEIALMETFENPDIEPGEITTITKQVKVTNEGQNYSAVRVNVKFSSSKILDYTNVDYNTADWVQDGDYWYYKTPLEPGEETTPLFNRLVLTNPTEEQVQDFDVYVYAESRNCEENSTTAQIKDCF